MIFRLCAFRKLPSFDSVASNLYRSITFEFFTRFIQKTRSDSTVDASLIGMDLGAGFKGNVVGLDARDVPNDAR